MDSKSIASFTKVGAGGSAAAAFSNDAPNGGAAIERPFKAVLKAMLRVGDDYAEAQEMARQAQKKSPRLRE
jgi:hypothetical protein